MRLGLKRELLAVCLVTSLAAGAAAYLGHQASNDIWGRTRVLHDDYTVALRELALAGQGISSLSFSISRAHTPGVGTREDQEKCDLAISEVDARLTAFADMHLRSSHGGRSERADLDAFLREWEDIKALDGEFDKPFRDAATDPKAATTLAGLQDDLRAEMVSAEVSFTRLVDTVGTVSDELFASNMAEFRDDSRDTTAIGIFAVALIILSGFWQARRLSRLLSEGMTALNARSLDVTEAAGQVSTVSHSLARGASSQAASIEETSAALEQIAMMTRRNAGDATQSSEYTAAARTSAEKSSELMGELVQAMDGIKGSADEIGKIIKVIDEIAFQTNMLALNAAVEAARAGEAGMGFAVVADEVRNLAQRSAQAASDTAGKIEESIRRSNTGVAITRRVHAALEEIVGRVRKIDELTHQISSASQEQARGIAQTNASVAEMDRVTQQNAGLAEAVATSATEATSQARQLLTVSAMIDELLHGARTVPAHPVLAAERPAAPRPPTPMLTRRRAVADGSGVRGLPPRRAGDADPAAAAVPAARTGKLAIPLPGDFVDY